MADGFKNSTKTHYFKGGDMGTKGAAKVAKVMGDFKKGAVKKAVGGPVLPSQAPAAAAAGVARRPTMPSQADNANRVTTMKTGGSMPVESTSARPVKVGRTPEEIRQKAAVARGNRMQALEAIEEAKLMRERPVRGGGLQNRPLGRGAAMDGPVIKRAVGGPALPAQAAARATEALASRPTAPSQAAAGMARRPDRPTQAIQPVRRKGGGLSVMPRGKKC